MAHKKPVVAAKPPQNVLVVEERDENKKRRRSLEDRNPLGSAGGVFFGRTVDGKYVPHVFIPKILKTDVRRKYAQVFTNVFNSCDATMVDSYIETFMRPDFAFVQRFSDDLRAHSPPDGKLPNCQIAGKFWTEKMLSSPDLRFELRDTQIKARSDGTGTVKFAFRMSGTFFVPDEAFQRIACDFLVAESAHADGDWLCPDPPRDSYADLLQATVVCMPDPDDATKLNSCTIHSLRRNSVASSLLLLEIDRAIFQRSCNPDEYMWKECRSPQRPVTYDFDGSAVMHLDANNRIHHLDFEGY